MTKKEAREREQRIKNGLHRMGYDLQSVVDGYQIADRDNIVRFGRYNGMSLDDALMVLVRLETQLSSL